MTGGLPGSAAALGGLPAMPAGMSGRSGMGGIAAVPVMRRIPGISAMPPDMAAQMARLMPGAGLDAAQSNEIAELQK